MLPRYPLREGASQSLREVWLSSLPGCQHRAVQVPQPPRAAPARGSRGLELAVWVALRVLEGRDCAEPRGAPPPPPPGSRGAAGLGRAGCRATAVASGDAHAHFPLGGRTNAGCGGAVGGCAAGRAEEPARRNRAGDPPAFMIRGWRATSGPHYLVRGRRTAGHPPQHLLARVPSSPCPPALSECRRKGGSDSTHASQPDCHMPGSLPAKVPGGWKGRFVTGDGLFPYRETLSDGEAYLRF